MAHVKGTPTVLTVVGARPQFIKAAVVSRSLDRSGGLSEILVHTGQHYDDNMSDVFFRELGLRAPDVNLGIGSGSHGVQTGRMLQSIEELLVEHRPDRVLLYGDTNSTAAGALAAVKLHVPVAHVEAGLRLFDLSIPEEVNRLVADHLSDVVFCPTATAMTNLRREGFSEERLHEVGDVMYDVTLLMTAAAARTGPAALERVGVRPGGYVLATVHRAHDTDDPARLAAIFEGLARVSTRHPVVVPLHPRTRQALERDGLLEGTARRLRLTAPLGYLDMLWLERHARAIVTDSGGVQKEAFFHRVPCVTLMPRTPWQELVDLGWNHPVDPVDAQAVELAVEAALEAPAGAEASPYGDGHAAERVVEVLLARTPRCRESTSAYRACSAAAFTSTS